MKAYSPIRSLAAAALLVASSSFAFAQTQPPQAANEQDEIINIPASPGLGEDDVLQILRSGDKTETNSYVTRVFELKHIAAYEINLLVDQAIAKEKGSVRTAETRPDDGSKPRSFIVVTTTKEQMPSVANLIETVDTPYLVNSQGSARRAIRLKNRRASDLGTVLRNTRLTSQARVFADDLTNSLYYDDTDYVIKQVENYVQFFDVPVPQIEFQVEIIEVRQDDAKRLGVDWDAWKRTIGGQIDLTGNWFEGGDKFARADALLALDASALASFLNYTVQTGTAKLVQSSRLNASNLRPAIISDKRRVPFYDYQRTTQTAASLTEVNPRVDSNHEAESGEPNTTAPRVVTIIPGQTNRLADLGTDNEGILVTISPVIGTETVTADIVIAVNSVTNFDQLGKPLVTQQDLTNQFTLQNGKTLLLGTLERETATTGRSGIPGLRDLPVLKYIFSVESTKKQKSRLFILATPTFSNMAFGAKNLEELKAGAVPLRIEEREVRPDTPQHLTPQQLSAK